MIIPKFLLNLVVLIIIHFDNNNIKEKLLILFQIKLFSFIQNIFIV